MRYRQYTHSVHLHTLLQAHHHFNYIYVNNMSSTINHQPSTIIQLSTDTTSSTTNYTTIHLQTLHGIKKAGVPSRTSRHSYVSIMHYFLCISIITLIIIIVISILMICHMRQGSSNDKHSRPEQWRTSQTLRLYIYIYISIYIYMYVCIYIYIYIDTYT